MRSPIRKSLLRQITLMGGDRRIIAIGGALLLCLSLALFQGLGMLYGISFIVPGVLFIVVLWVARSLHKADPDMVDVWQRAMKYRHYYPAKSHIGVPHPEVKRFTK